MNAPDNMYLPDVQSAADARNIAIQRVGVKSLAHPLLVATARGPQPSVASVDLTVALPAEQKGTHMSRFIDVLQSHRDPLSHASLHALLERMLQRLDAHEGAITMRLPYFVLKTAPVSGVESMMDYQLTLAIERAGGATLYRQKVVVPVTSLCPCSKKVADYGAHNQRAHITLTLDLTSADGRRRTDPRRRGCRVVRGLGLAEACRREVRDRARLRQSQVRRGRRARRRGTRSMPTRAVSAYVVEAENFESIHNHSAYALIERDKRA